MNERLFDMPLVGHDRDHALARPSDPATSHMADAKLRKREGPAWAIKPGTHRHIALECFVNSSVPLIPEDVKVMTGIDGIWKRVSDLKKNGFIRETGQTRISREGASADLYEITEAGQAAYARLGPAGR